MNLFDLRPENEELVLRRIEVLLSQKLKKKYPALNDVVEASKGAFAQDEKTIVTPAKTFAAQSNAALHTITKKKTTPKKASPLHRNVAIFGFVALVVLILWGMLF